MKKRIGLVVLALMIVLLAVAFVEPTGTVPGLLRGESFYGGRPAHVWARALRDPNVDEQAVAVQQLKAGGRAAMPVLIEVLKSRRDRTWEGAQARWKAAELLGQLG